MLIVCYCEIWWGFGTINSSLAVDAPYLYQRKRQGMQLPTPPNPDTAPNFSNFSYFHASLLHPASVKYLTIILRNRAEYHLILSRRGRRPSWLNQGIFRKIEQDNCFIIQQILIDYHFHNEKNYSSMMKTLKASNT